MRKIRQAALVAAFVALCSCAREAKQAKAEAAAPVPQVIEVTVASAKSRLTERVVSVTGSLAADETVNLSSEVPGVLASIPVDFGQTVQKGQTVAQIDARELTLQVERARGSLAQALARIGLGLTGDESKVETSPAVRQGQAQYEDAKSKFDNAAKLVATGDIARERYTELDKAMRAREAALQATRDELRTQVAAIQALRADYNLAQKRLSDTLIKAPMDGAIGAKLISPGQYVKENVPILTLVKAYPLRLRADIPESIVSEVKTGSTLTFATNAVEGETFEAVVRQLNPSLDSRSRALTAEARMTRADSRLKPGMFVQVRIVVARAVPTITVPKSALYTLAGLTKVYVVKDGAVVERRVEPGAEDGQWIELPGAQVSDGDVVVTSNLASLVQGTKVRPRS